MKEVNPCFNPIINMKRKSWSLEKKKKKKSNDTYTQKYL
jgi:hypothetical protein